MEVEKEQCRDRHCDVEDQHHAELESRVQCRRDNDLQQTEHDQVPIDSIGLALVEGGDLQVDQEVSDRHQLISRVALKEIAERGKQGQYHRQIRHDAMQSKPTQYVRKNHPAMHIHLILNHQQV